MKQNKTVILTGCSSGIGKSLMKKLINENYNVIGICRNPYNLKKNLNINSKRLKILKCNLLNLNQLKKLIKSLKKIKNINILINNAGSIFNSKKNIISNLDQSYFLNCFVPFLLVYKLKSNFQNNSENLVLNIGSNASKLFPINNNDLKFPSEHMSYKMYCKSKLYLLYITQKLAEITPKNINCCYVHPGLVKTNIANNLNLLLRLGFNISNLIYGITPKKSSDYIYNKIIKKKYYNSMYFDYNKPSKPKKIIIKKFYSEKICKKLFLIIKEKFRAS